MTTDPSLTPCPECKMAPGHHWRCMLGTEESLRTQLAEVTRERDEARRNLAEAVAVNATVIAESDRRKAERDEARAELVDAESLVAATYAKLLAALKVVEAAKAWHAAWADFDEALPDEQALAAAVDSYLGLTHTETMLVGDQVLTFETEGE